MNDHLCYSFYIFVSTVFFRQTSDGNMYDLSSLALSESNYISHKYTGAHYYINICRVVNPVQSAVNCPAGAAGCMSQLDHSTNTTK